MKTTTSTKDSRNQSDRRSTPTPVISRYTLQGGQRKTVRRDYEKGKHLFVDLYSTRLFIAVLVLLLLSCFDAYMTLTLIDRGSVYEANPLMAYFLDYGIMHFTAAKLIMTITAICILCLFKNVRLTRIGLPLAINIYLLIVAYEFYIFLI